MSIYLQDIPLEEAHARFSGALAAAGLDGLLGIEEHPLGEQLLGRVLAASIWVRRPVPHYDAAAMDGFALRSADTASASPANALTFTANTHALYLDTGQPLPADFDCVVPVEEVEALDPEQRPAKDPRQAATIRLRAPLAPWQHVRALGEDMVTGQLLLPAGHILRPVDLGAIAAAGHSQVSLARRPRVAILPTGTELVSIDQEPQPGEISESNSLILASQVLAWGGEAFRFPITPDDPGVLKQRIQEAADKHDLILVNAGSSAGSHDFLAEVLDDLGQLLVHGIAVRPGHPVILGMIPLSGGAKPLVGVPGYPVSAALTGELFVEPLLARWQGRQPRQPETVSAELTRKVTSPAGDDDYLRVSLGRVNGRLLASPLPRGAGVLSSLLRADGLALLPRGAQGAAAGESLRAQLYASRQEIERTILISGSHDLSLDLIAQSLAELGRRLVSNNVGSLGGLLALSRGHAHLAGSHLLDPESGHYNLAYVQEYLPGMPVVVLALVHRQQGLMLPAGNPRHLRNLVDLADPEIRFVNRQRGSGTRLLLDHHLSLLGIDPSSVSGYLHEEYNHLAVATAVASGRADCGLGIPAAAHALKLDFVPLFEERYDLVIPEPTYSSELLAPLLALLDDLKLRQVINAMPGYDVRQMGKVIARL